jgi:hypothetical protein
MTAWSAEKFVIANFPITQQTNTYFSLRDRLKKEPKHNYVKTILCLLVRTAIILYGLTTYIIFHSSGSIHL